MKNFFRLAVVFLMLSFVIPVSAMTTTSVHKTEKSSVCKNLEKATIVVDAKVLDVVIIHYFKPDKSLKLVIVDYLKSDQITIINKQIKSYQFENSFINSKVFSKPDKINSHYLYGPDLRC